MLVHAEVVLNSEVDTQVKTVKVIREQKLFEFNLFIISVCYWYFLWSVHSNVYFIIMKMYNYLLTLL